MAYLSQIIVRQHVYVNNKHKLRGCATTSYIAQKVDWIVVSGSVVSGGGVNVVIETARVRRRG